MDISINHFLQRFEQDLQLYLTYQIESLPLVEDWLIAQYKAKDIYNPENIPLFDRVGRFIGEIFRKYFGGNWYVDLDDNEHLFYQWAGIIRSYTPNQLYPIYPHAWVTTSIDRRTGKFITQRFEQYFNKDIKD